MKVPRVLMVLLLLATMFTGALPGRLTGVARAGDAPLPVDGLVPAPTAPAYRAAVDRRLLAALEEAIEPVQAIVTFHGEGGPSQEQVSLLKQAGITRGITLHNLPMAGVLVSREQVEQLAANPAVRSIYLNRELTYENYEATALTGVDKVEQDPEMTRRNGGLPVSGAGIGVLINDSGVDGTHPDLEYGRHLVQNVLGQTNLKSWSSLLPATYVENIPNTDSTGGHGTHVAGIVGGTGEAGDTLVDGGRKYRGVAPEASLIGYGSGAALFLLDTLGGFDYALEPQVQQDYKIRVVTNSWGDTSDVGTPFDPEDPVNVATYQLFLRGVTVVFSAGNSGPIANTITGNFKKAPWVVMVAAGDKQGRLADFSSRGVPGRGGTVTLDGVAYRWVDRPTVTAPGVDIYSARALAPDGLLGVADDALVLQPQEAPYYTALSGTSMAAPHVAGIVALMLEANRSLNALEVKQILEATATNIPGTEPYEVGAGYVNAYAAVDLAYRWADRENYEYGQTLNLWKSFNSQVEVVQSETAFTIDYNPTLTTYNSTTFEVPPGQASLTAKIQAAGLLGATGNTLNLVLIDPDGQEYSSGVYLLFPLYQDRAVGVTGPKPGTWKVEIRGLKGAAANPVPVALPEQVRGSVTFTAVNSGNVTDIAVVREQDAIQIVLSERLMDGYAGGLFKPDQPLSRRELAQYLVMGAGIRQATPPTGQTAFADVPAADLPNVAAVTATGAALKNIWQNQRGVMLPTGSGTTFSPEQPVTREELAYAFVQVLGLEDQLPEVEELTVQYKDRRIPIQDADQVNPALRGHVQAAIDLNILNVQYEIIQGPYDFEPTLVAYFKPRAAVTRAAYAQHLFRFYTGYLASPPSSVPEESGGEEPGEPGEITRPPYPEGYSPQTRTGTYAVPLVLVEFPDKAHNDPKATALGLALGEGVDLNDYSGEHYERLMFAADQSSMYTYFLLNSYGRFHLTGEVIPHSLAEANRDQIDWGTYPLTNPYDPGFDRSPNENHPGYPLGAAHYTAAGMQKYWDGWYLLPYDSTYYGQDTADAGVWALSGGVIPGNIDDFYGPPGKIAYDAAQVADRKVDGTPAGIDWSRFDNDNDGYVDGFIVVHAGVGQEESLVNTDEWSHRSSLGAMGYYDDEQGMAGYRTATPWKCAAEGVSLEQCPADQVLHYHINNYTLMPENGKLGVFAHEFNHGLGVPDLYNTAYTGDYVDNWSLQASGSWDGDPPGSRPSMIDVYLKRMNGWLEGIDEPITNPTAGTRIGTIVKEGTYTVYDLNSHPSAYRIELPPQRLADLPTISQDCREATEEQREAGQCNRNYVWHSNQGNDFDDQNSPSHKLAVPLDLPAVSGGEQLTLRFDTWYEIEPDYDFGYVQVKERNNETDADAFDLRGWTNLANADGYTTNNDLNGNNEGNGITGNSGEGPSHQSAGLQGRINNLAGYGDPEWTTLEFDLTAFAGKRIWLRFRYKTDPGLAKRGWMVDNIRILRGEETLEQWSFDNNNPGPFRSQFWLYSDGTSPMEHSYLISARMFNKIWGDGVHYQPDDRRFTFDDAKPSAYEEGLLIWLIDETCGVGNNDVPPCEAPVLDDPSGEYGKATFLPGDVYQDDNFQDYYRNSENGNAIAFDRVRIEVLKMDRETGAITFTVRFHTVELVAGQTQVKGDGKSQVNLDVTIRRPSGQVTDEALPVTLTTG